MEHLHEEGGVGSVALHVLEIQEVLPSLGHRPGKIIFSKNWHVRYFFRIFSIFTSVRGSALTAGCTSPAIRRALRFIDYQSSCQIDIGSESVYIQSGFDLIGIFAFEFVTAIHYLLLKVKESGKNLSPFTIWHLKVQFNISEEISINLKGFSLIGFVWILGVQPLFGAFFQRYMSVFFGFKKSGNSKESFLIILLFSSQLSILPSPLKDSCKF